MDILIYCNRHDRKQPFVLALQSWATREGHVAEVRSILDPIPVEGDLVILMGARRKGSLERLARGGVNFLYIDLALNGNPEYRRLSFNNFLPTPYFNFWRKSSDRREKFGWGIQPWRNNGRRKHVLIITQSPYYHVCENLPQPDDYARQIKQCLRGYTTRPVRYRAKAGSADNWFDQDDGYMPGSTLTQDLENCHCVITHGSGSCIEAIRRGIPCIVLGDAVAKPISSISLTDIERLRFVYEEQRLQWLNNLAYCQWSADEFKSGKAIASIQQYL
jgi:hypothetical protein